MSMGHCRIKLVPLGDLGLGFASFGWRLLASTLAFLLLTESCLNTAID